MRILGPFCSLAGNICFPVWEYYVPRQGTIFACLSVVSFYNCSYRYFYLLNCKFLLITAISSTDYIDTADGDIGTDGLTWKDGEVGHRDTTDVVNAYICLDTEI